MMPDHRGRVEADRPAALVQAPADVHVVTRHAELEVEASDRREALLAERHVAAGDVLGFAIGEQYVHRTAG